MTESKMPERIILVKGKVEVFHTLDKLDKAGLNLQQAADALQRIFVSARVEAERLAKMQRERVN